MIHPPGLDGARFGEASDGDPRTDDEAVARFARHGAPTAIAFPHQVHGATVQLATTAGAAGDADALITTTADLGVAVATADCVPVIIEGPGFAAVVHAGWRGIVGGVMAATVEAIGSMGLTPRQAAVGPAIGPCCYQVGAEVLDRLAGHVATTTWGAPSVDLPAAATMALGDLPVWRSERCTFTDHRLNSHRRDRTARRQVAVAWCRSGP
ncbi:MAG: laccase domain-containing protein [Acidimicrobiia bacterium]|nr:laccase domain-containing protein [Acidimicrobiia bacterium]